MTQICYRIIKWSTLTHITNAYREKKMKYVLTLSSLSLNDFSSKYCHWYISVFTKSKSYNILTVWMFGVFFLSWIMKCNHQHCHTVGRDVTILVLKKKKKKKCFGWDTWQHVFVYSLSFWKMKCKYIIKYRGQYSMHTWDASEFLIPSQNHQQWHVHTQKILYEFEFWFHAISHKICRASIRTILRLELCSVYNTNKNYKQISIKTNFSMIFFSLLLTFI